MKKLIITGAVVAAAGLSLAACSSQSAPASHAAPVASHSVAAAPTTAAPTTAPKPKPTINYGAQYLADVAQANTDAARITDADGITSPDVVTLGSAAVGVAKSLLTQTWPASAQADIKTLALDAEKIQADIQNQDITSLSTDLEAQKAEANVVRVELGLPAGGS